MLVTERSACSLGQVRGGGSHGIAARVTDDLARRVIVHRRECHRAELTGLQNESRGDRQGGVVRVLDDGAAFHGSRSTEGDRTTHEIGRVGLEGEVVGGNHRGIVQEIALLGQRRAGEEHGVGAGFRQWERGQASAGRGREADSFGRRLE